MTPPATDCGLDRRSIYRGWAVHGLMQKEADPISSVDDTREEGLPRSYPLSTACNTRSLAWPSSK